MKKTLLCLFGGRSTEYEVSLMSVCSVLRALDTEKYDTLMLGITREGTWYLYNGTLEAIADDTWHTDRAHLRRAMLSPSPADGGCLYAEVPDCGTELHSFAAYKIDVVFPVMHGAFCEDGTLQGLLSMAGIPYVGPHCAASAVSMDKAFTKMILSNYPVDQARYTVITRTALMRDPDAAIAAAEAVDAYPLFVKPANAGSSVGVSKARSKEELLRALRCAAEYDDKILVEECIVGREVECAVLGNEDAQTAVPGEIDPGSDFYDYDTKYVNATSADHIPARISDRALARVRAQAKLIYEALGCRGLSRVDFFVTAEERIVFNEINTLPGFTSISMYPKMWNHMGKSTTALIDALIEYAMQA